MDTNWERIREIFDAASQMKPGSRGDYLDRACDGNEEIRREVESLLSSIDRAGSFLEQPAIEAPTEELEALHEGQTVGHYTIVKRIGFGGMGEVYLANDTILDRSVAIKVLNKKFGRHEDNIRRFIREAKAASALNHPNILTIFEIGELEGSHYIASEFVEGETLRDIIKKGKLAYPRILDITGQIASALAAAHKARIVHRDIKPENIIVRDDGYVKVLDFGLAKLIPDQASAILDADSTPIQNTTVSGVILGTVNYMSPEQAKGEKVDERTDIFSLGVVMYEMITGRRPFEGNSTPESFANLINKDPKPLATHASGTPEQLQRIIAKMLDKNRDERYQSMPDFIADTTSLRDGKTSESTFERLSSGSGDRTIQWPQTTGSGAHSTQQTSAIFTAWHQHRRAIIALGILLLAGISVGGYFLAQKAAIFSSNEINSVAVMPFVNESGNPDVEYLSDGMTDTLISSLSELPNIKVKARTSVFRYKGKEIDPRAVGRELGVQAIVNGRVAQRDGRTNVTLEVIDAATEYVIFSTKYDKPQSELVILQSEIARDVSAKLQSKLSEAEEAKVTKTHTADPEALQLYLQGQFYRNRGGRTNVLLATDYFKKAIEKDPNYALAYAGLALNYSSYDLYNLVPDWQGANAAAKRSLELDDSLAEAQLASGNPRRAIELNPDYADAHVGLCISLTMTKRFDEGIAECREAYELDPSSVLVTMRVGVAYFFARRPDEAIEWLSRAHEMDRTLWVPLGYLGGAQTLKGQYTQAAETFRKTIQISDGSPNAKSHLAYALAKAGQRDEALKLIVELKRQGEREHINSFHFAVPYIGLGDKDEAFFWLGKGVDERSLGFAMLDVHPWFDDLRSDPRFEALLERFKHQ